MSGSINYAYLLSGADGAGTDSLLSTLYGTGQTAATFSNPLAALRTAEKDQTRDIALTAKQSDVARDIAGFKAAVAKAKTPADLLKNPTVMKVLLTANGMEDQIPYSALAQRALLSNTHVANNLANTLNVIDSRWKPMVQTYDFATQGLKVLSKPQVLSTVTNAYAEIIWRKSLDATTPGLSNAISFRARAASVSSADQILGDPVLRDVITVGLNIPREIAFQSVSTQEKVITTHLDLKKLKDKHFVDTLTQEYLLNKSNSAAQLGAGFSLDQLATRANGLVV